MKYLCLRKCYVGDYLYEKGEVYDLPDSLEKSPKNFQSLEKKAEPAISEVATEEKQTEDEQIGSEDAPLYVSDKPPKKKRRG